MCSLAPRAAAPGFGATAFLDRRRGVVAAAVVARATSGDDNAGDEPTRRARASEASTAPARKRGRHDAFEHNVVDPAPSALRIRMDKELVALQGLLKRAKLLPRSAPPSEKKYAPAPRRPEAPVVSSPSAAKRRASPSEPATGAAFAPAKQQRAEAKNPTAPEVPNNKQRPAEAPAEAKQQQQQQQRPVQRAAAAKTEVPKKRRPEEEKELARTAAREEFRQMLLEMEKAALPDETIYPEELEKLGIAPFEFVVTRTRKQAWLEDHAKKVVFVGV